MKCLAPPATLPYTSVYCSLRVSPVQPHVPLRDVVPNELHGSLAECLGVRDMRQVPARKRGQLRVGQEVVQCQGGGLGEVVICAVHHQGGGPDSFGLAGDVQS